MRHPPLSDAYVADINVRIAIVADDPVAICHFHTARAAPVPDDTDAYSVASGVQAHNTHDEVEDDPLDFSIYMDQAPLTVQMGSPLELVQQLFVKLGARYVVVTDQDGLCEFFCLVFILVQWLMAAADEGVIDKKAWLAFLSSLGDH